jgi:hypothetical protein
MMPDPLLALSALRSKPFAPNSRYYGVETAQAVLPDGRTVVYLRRRFAPPGEHFELLYEHTVQQGERLDTIAAQALGDPELFWRLCDANNALDPAELEATGQTIRITLPDQIPGGQSGV